MFNFFSKKKAKEPSKENNTRIFNTQTSREQVVSNYQFTQTVTEKVINENGVVTKETVVKQSNQSPTTKFSFDDFGLQSGRLQSTIPLSFNESFEKITSEQTPAKFTPRAARSAFQYSSLRTKPEEIFSPKYESNQSLNSNSATDRSFPSSSPKSSYTIKDISSPVTVHVKKSYRFYDKLSKVPTYATHGNKRGSMLLINNMQFEKNKAAERRGAEIDERNVKELFKQLGFEIQNHTNLKKDDMANVLKKYSKRATLKSVDINAVVMMSHGMGRRGGDTVIMGSDDKELPISDVIDFFSNKNCPALLNKPKIFLFQCCRGLSYQIVESDATTFQEGQKNNKAESDILIAYSTIPGYVSHRNPNLGTWFIQAICKVFMDHACDTHIEDLLKMVDAMLSSLGNESGYAQTSSYENRGFKKCYLHPM